MLTLVHAPRSRSSRFLWLLEEIGEPYDIQYVSIRLLENRRCVVLQERDFAVRMRIRRIERARPIDAVIRCCASQWGAGARIPRPRRAWDLPRSALIQGMSGKAATKAGLERTHCRFVQRLSPKNGTASGIGRDAPSAAPKRPA